MRIIMLGAPGTGKGTQGILLAQNYAVPNISTGEILRTAVDKGTEFGLKAKKYMDSGELVPDEVMIGIVKQRIDEDDCDNGFILDGFPRTVIQAESLDKHLQSIGKPIQHVLALEVETEKLVQRLTSRRVCRSCGKDYNVITNPPPQNNLCGKCGGEIWQRPDDNEETITTRLRVYQEKTQPLKDYYARKKILKIFDGDGPVELVHQQLREFLA
jgi:adenylate kinase